MIVLNTNGKYEYSNFCTKENSENAERWLDNYKDFLIQHRENIIMEFSPKAQKVSIHFATIPSERKDTNGSPCDTSLTAVDIGYSGDDYTILLSVIKYALIEGYDSLGVIFDYIFKEDFINVKNQDDIQTDEKEENVNLRLDKLCRKHLQISFPETNPVDIPSIDTFDCLWKSVSTLNYNDFFAAIQKAKDDQDTDKFILIVTRRNISEEKVNKFLDTSNDKKIVKAFIIRIGSDTETEWSTLPIKKKSMPISTKVGIAAVAAGIITICLMLVLMPTKEVKTSSIISEQDSLNYLKEMVINYADSLKVSNHRLDSLINLQSFNDTFCKNCINLDLSEFNKTGTIKTLVTTTSDTIVTLIDTDSLPNKCKVRVFKNGVQKGNQIPIDLK